MWYGGADVKLQMLAQQLLLAANAFRIGLVAQVILPAFNSDPHGAFVNVPSATQTVDGLAHVLDSFLRELASSPEPSCTKMGRSVSLADNVVLMVSGDTPKNPYERSGWPDGFQANVNWVYVQSNSYIRAGWFGKVLPTSAIYFDPATGSDNAAASYDDVTSASLAAVLYAVTRGDKLAVGTYFSGPYQGLILPAP